MDQENTENSKTKAEEVNLHQNITPMKRNLTHIISLLLWQIPWICLEHTRQKCPNWIKWTFQCFPIHVRHVQPGIRNISLRTEDFYPWPYSCKSWIYYGSVTVRAPSTLGTSTFSIGLSGKASELKWSIWKASAKNPSVVFTFLSSLGTNFLQRPSLLFRAGADQ